MSEQPPEGGAPERKGIALHLPVWGWALIAGAAAGLVYFVRKRQAASAAASSTTATTGTGPDPNAPDIIPVDQGGDDKSDADLLAAIQKLQGPPSVAQGPPDDDDDGPGHPPVHGKPIPVPAPPKKKPPAPKPGGPSSHWVSVNSFEDLQELARSYGHSWEELWAYQLEKGVRPASTQAKLKREGARRAFHNGSEAAVPASWRKRRR